MIRNKTSETSTVAEKIVKLGALAKPLVESDCLCNARAKPLANFTNIKTPIKFT